MSRNLVNVNIEILHLGDHLTRKDIKKVHWVRFDTDFMSHPDFFNLTADELKVWIHFVCVAGKMRHNKIRMNVPHTAHTLRVKNSAIFGMLKKLEGKRLKSLGEHESVRAEHEPVQIRTDPLPRGEEKREEEKRKEKRTAEETQTPQQPQIDLSNSTKAFDDKFKPEVIEVESLLKPRYGKRLFRYAPGIIDHWGSVKNFTEWAYDVESRYKKNEGGKSTSLVGWVEICLKKELGIIA